MSLGRAARLLHPTSGESQRGAGARVTHVDILKAERRGIDGRTDGRIRAVAVRREHHPARGWAAGEGDGPNSSAQRLGRGAANVGWRLILLAIVAYLPIWGLGAVFDSFISNLPGT
jgi:hypothetical protein